MLHSITCFSELDGDRLMDVYAGSNRDNAGEFYPDEETAAAVKKVEERFLDWLRSDFFTGPGRTYWVLEEDGDWVSALRTSRIRPGLYYLEALETRPDRRRRGCAVRLLRGVLAALEAEGPFALYDCVSKGNAASLRTHERCGFRIAAENGFNYLSGETNERTFGLVYRHAEGERDRRDTAEDLVIRAAVPEDEDRIRALFREMLRTIYQTDTVKGYGPGALDRYWRGGEDRIFAAAEGKVVGFLSVEIHREAQDYAYLDDFSVTESMRGRGIGTALLKRAETYARGLGIPAVLLHVEKSNGQARRLYERLGWSVFRDDGSRLLLLKEL